MVTGGHAKVEELDKVDLVERSLRPACYAIGEQPAAVSSKRTVLEISLGNQYGNPASAATASATTEPSDRAAGL